MANRERDDEPQQYGGRVQDQSDAMQRARDYPGRFGSNPNPDPKAIQRQQEVDRVKG